MFPRLLFLVVGQARRAPSHRAATSAAKSIDSSTCFVQGLGNGYLLVLVINYPLRGGGACGRIDLENNTLKMNRFDPGFEIRIEEAICFKGRPSRMVMEEACGEIRRFLWSTLGGGARTCTYLGRKAPVHKKVLDTEEKALCNCMDFLYRHSMSIRPDFTFSSSGLVQTRLRLLQLVLPGSHALLNDMGWVED